MTPTAITPAARRAAKGKTAAPGHRRTLRRKGLPRRVSGPARAKTAGVATTRKAAAPAPVRARPEALPERSRTRTASPARHTRRISGARIRTRRNAPLGARALAYVRALPDHSLLDRVVRGRAWIPILGVMLVGIVAMQVEVLKLGASMGRAIERGSVLQARNEALRESVAQLADDQRIERLAGNLGMVMPAPGTTGFLTAGRSQAAKAASSLKAPDATTFLAQLNQSIAAVAPPAPATAGTTSTLSTTSATAAGTSGAPAGASTGAPATGAPATGTAPATSSPSVQSSSGAGTTSAVGITTATGTTAAVTAAATGGAAPTTGG